MKLELTKHLDQVRDTVTEVDRIVSSHKYPGDRRTVMVMGLLSTIIQHHRSMLQLIKSAGTAGSSWALARDVVKGTRYGLWINSCATEEQILPALVSVRNQPNVLDLLGTFRPTARYKGWRLSSHPAFLHRRDAIQSFSQCSSRVGRSLIESICRVELPSGS